jgi:hypothetical protein
MNKVRISFIKDGAVIKRFDRTAKDATEAAQLAGDIARDSGIAHDSRKIEFERKFKAALTIDGKPEIIESKAFDDEGAEAVARNWSALVKKEFTAIKIQFLEA